MRADLGQQCCSRGSQRRAGLGRGASWFALGAITVASSRRIGSAKGFSKAAESLSAASPPQLGPRRRRGRAHKQQFGRRRIPRATCGCAAVSRWAGALAAVLLLKLKLKAMVMQNQGRAHGRGLHDASTAFAAGCGLASCRRLDWACGALAGDADRLPPPAHGEQTSGAPLPPAARWLNVRA